MPELLGRLQSALADRYRLDREIGAGGMATVYLAQDVRHDRKVALKVLRPELAAVIGAERFLAEIKLTANLQHPHILPLFDSGEADSYLFYVMPFVEGETLRDRLTREKQLPVPDALRIAGEVASALDYAHRHGVVHRDIKPENILLHDGQALVADFGIALAASKASGSRMTETGMSLGTPHYMSPEQAMGEREITARSDVYALGAVLYEMLTGEPPFTGNTAQAVVARVLTESPRPLATQRHTIPRHVEAAVITALEKLPADRFATAAEFAEALKDKTYTSHGSLEAAAAPAAPARHADARLERPSPSALIGGHGRGHGRGALGLAPPGAGPAAHPVQPGAPCDRRRLQPVSNTGGARIAISPDGRADRLLRTGRGRVPALGPAARPARRPRRSRAPRGRRAPSSRRTAGGSASSRTARSCASPRSRVPPRSRSPTRRIPPPATGARTGTSTSRWTRGSPGCGPPAAPIEPVYTLPRPERGGHRVAQRAPGRQGHDLPDAARRAGRGRLGHHGDGAAARHAARAHPRHLRPLLTYRPSPRGHLGRKAHRHPVRREEAGADRLAGGAHRGYRRENGRVQRRSGSLGQRHADLYDGRRARLPPRVLGEPRGDGDAGGSGVGPAGHPRRHRALAGRQGSGRRAGAERAGRHLGQAAPHRSVFPDHFRRHLVGPARLVARQPRGALLHRPGGCRGRSSPTRTGQTERGTRAR